METQTKIPEVVQAALFAVLIVLLAFTPFLQHIPLRYLRTVLIPIPVIVGSLILGPKRGALLGLVYAMTGLSSTTVDPNTNALILVPLGTSGALWDKVGAAAACILPRVLVGILPFYVFRAARRFTKTSFPGLALAGLLGVLINTPAVTGLTHDVFRNITLAAISFSPEKFSLFLQSLTSSRELPEAAVSALLVCVLGRFVWRIK